MLIVHPAGLRRPGEPGRWVAVGFETIEVRNSPLIDYRTTADGLTRDHLHGFFVGWPNPPSPETHLRLLRGSAVIALAQDRETRQVVGFATALTDGVLSAYIPLLEVLPRYREQGIGTALVRSILDQLGDLYMIDVTCDAVVQPFYARLGLTPSRGMALRRYDRQSGVS